MLASSISETLIFPVKITADPPSVKLTGSPSMLDRTGASLAGKISIFRLAILLFASPSLTVKVTVRGSVVGLSLVLV